VVSRAGRKRRGESGAAAVEFAIVLPLLLLIFLGCIDWGYYLFVAQIVTNAAREGARAGAIANAADRLTAAENAAGDYLVASRLRRTGITAADATIGASDGVRVTINYPVGSVTGFLPTTLLPADAFAVATMRNENP
jgi:Flp pilus assembly protein TadG